MSDIKDKEVDSGAAPDSANAENPESATKNTEEGAGETSIKEEPKDDLAKNDAAGALDIDMEDVNPEENDIDIDFELEEPMVEEATANIPGPVPVTRKDKTLTEFLDNMNEYAPIIPDAVTDYYLAKSGFQTNDVRIKRLLALATQKFISDLASDAYQHSRIRSSSSVSSASNPQARAKALVAGVGGAQVQSNSSGRSKIVLTMEDLSSASSEYGLNLKRPDFYR